MSYETRKTLLQRIEEVRNHPLITYVTSIRPGLSGNMAGDSIEHIIDQVRLVPID